MKKVREYIAEYEVYCGNGLTQERAQAEVLSQMWAEIWELKESRRARTNSAITAVLDEIDNKWRKFSLAIAADRIEEMFSLIVQAELPAVFSVWKNKYEMTGNIRREEIRRKLTSIAHRMK